MPENQNQAPEQLESCPGSPNCVCSTDTDPAHQIAPLKIAGDSEQAWQTLLEVLRADGSITIITATERYIRAEAKTRLLRFTDDVEFLLNLEQGVIDIRSASRIGYSDLGKNRKRLEGIRSAMGSQT